MDDGFMYYFPTGAGAMSPEDLRDIADILDEANEPWRAQIEKDLSDEGV